MGRFNRGIKNHLKNVLKTVRSVVSVFLETVFNTNTKSKTDTVKPSQHCSLLGFCVVECYEKYILFSMIVLFYKIVLSVY
jgi:hypothetical protein